MSNTALKILILEDNDDLRDGWKLFFQTQGHHVRGAALADELLDEAGDFTPDIYIIDLNLPDADGLDVVKRIREIHPSVGIIITTARTFIGDKVRGYGNGADIYFTKPVDPQELLAAATSLVRRQQALHTNDNHLRLYVDRYMLTGREVSVKLSYTETTLLACLVRAAGQPLARWQIAELLGAGAEMLSDANLEMRIARLRKRLTSSGAEAPAIKAVHKQGYVLCCKVILY